LQRDLADGKKWPANSEGSCLKYLGLKVWPSPGEVFSDSEPVKFAAAAQSLPMNGIGTSGAGGD